MWKMVMVLLLGFAMAAAPARAEVSFKNDVAPILVERCSTCHNAEKKKGAYRVDSFETLMKTGESKQPPIVAGRVGESHLYQLLTTADEDERMPAKGERLTAGQVSIVERWIKEGAKFDGTDRAALLVSLVPATGHPQAPEKYPRPVPNMALAFSPDGKELAVGGYHEITFWDPADGKLLGRIGNIAQRTQRLAYWPDGTILAAASGTPGKVGEVKLLDPVNRTIAAELDRVGDMLFGLAFNVDGSKLACGGADNAIRTYDVKSRKREAVIEQHADWVLSLAWTPDREHLLSASRDKSARVLDAKKGTVEHAYFGHEEIVYCVAVSADGKTAYSGGKDKKIHLWSVKDGKKSGEITGFEDDVFGLVLGGKYLFACGADKKVRQFEGKELVRTYPEFGDWVYSIAYDAKNNRLAAGSYGGEVRVWNVGDGSLVSGFIAAPGFEKK